MFIQLKKNDTNKNVIPTMTSNTTPSGIVETNVNILAGTSAYQAFDGIGTTYFHSAINNTVGWLSYEFEKKTIINKYSLLCQLNYRDRAPKRWTFEGTNDGVSWDVLDSQSNQAVWTNNVKNVYTFNNEKSYKRYRININENNGGNYLVFVSLEMMGYHPELIVINDVLKKETFIKHGLSNSSTIYFDNNIEHIAYQKSNSTILGSGKVFRQTVDTLKHPIKKVMIESK